MKPVIPHSTTDDPEVDLTAAKVTDAELRRIVDTIPVLAWCNRPDGAQDICSASGVGLYGSTG